MSLIINNVLKGSIGINFDYQDSDEMFGYTVAGSYTVDISDLSFTDENGVLIAGREALKAAYQQKNITARIGADEYQYARITALSFSESPLVGSEPASITIEESKRLDSYANHTFAEYLPSPHLLESFDESFDFSMDGSAYSYTRNVQIKYKQNTETSEEFVNNIKVFASNYYHQVRPDLGYQQDGISENAKINKGFDGIVSETIDLINLTYNLNEKLDASFIEESENVSKKFTQTEALNAEGYPEKTITIELTSLRRDSSNVLKDAIQSTIDAVIAEEQNTFGPPSSIQRGMSRNGKKANLTISFSKAPKYYRDATVTYNCNEQKTEAFNEYPMVLEYCAVATNNQSRLQACRTFWQADSATATLAARVASLFPDAAAVYEKSRQTTFDYATGKISENTVFTDDDSYKPDLPDGILKYKVTVQSNNGVNRFTRVNDIESLKEKLTVSDLKTITQVTITAESVALPCFGPYHGKNFLNSKTSELNALLGVLEFYTISDQTTIDLSNGTTNRVINYVIPTA